MTTQTNSASLAPWKRGEVPTHWPDFAADREEAPAMGHSLVSLADLESEPSPANPALDLAQRARELDLRESEAELETRPVTRTDTGELRRVEIAAAIASELTGSDSRLALEAVTFGLESSHDPLVDDDEVSLDDDPDLVEDTTGDYIPALLDRTQGSFMRIASKVLIPFAAIVILVIAMGGTWSTADATPATPATTAAPPTRTTATAEEGEHPRSKSSRKDLSGKLNLNTASEDQLMMLPTVGPSKADRIVAWRKKNGGFKRTADLRHVKGFGYKTFKKLEPFLDVKGDTTLVAK